VSAAQELARVRPVIEGLSAAHPGTPISIDTSKASVAAAALDAGASMVNDVSAFRADPQMAALVADRGAECVLMHMRGEPRTMQKDPRYADVVDDVKAFLGERLAFALAEGVREERVLLDPGIGFGKTLEHNLELLRRLDELLGLGRPIVIGTSRKSFLGRIAARARGLDEPPGTDARVPGTLASNVLAFERGASVFRVHDVAPVREALAVAAATLGGGWTARSTQKTPTS
jgi:dihydropteroate synthase